MSNQNWLWLVFGVVITTVLVLDLFVFNRQKHEIRIKEALLWTGLWICLALSFGVGIYFFRGQEASLKFFAGYLLEESLSVDNLFVFLLIFSYFRVPPQYQHGVLFWGILGAIVMRAIFILAGVSLIRRFHWVLYLFGILLVFTGLRLVFEQNKGVRLEKNYMQSFISRCAVLSA